MPDRNIKYEIISSVSVFLITGNQVLESFLRHIAPEYASVPAYLRYLLLLCLINIHITEKTTTTVNRPFMVFYIIYSLYVLWYMSIGGEIPLSDMFHVPESVFQYIIYFLYIGIFILLARTIIKYLNIRLVWILWVCITLGNSLYYISLIGFETFQEFSKENTESQFIGPLTIAYQSSLPFVFCVFFNKYISSWKYFNFAICIIVAVAVGYVWLAATKRGPILWTFCTIIIVFFYKNRNIYKYLFKVGFIVIILFETVPVLLEMLKDFAPYSIERINAALYEGDTSYRLTEGESENVWSIAFEQWTRSVSSFLCGSNCRILQKGSFFYGSYPHNIILEFLLTMGLVGLLYFVYLVKKTYMTIGNVFTDNSNDKLLFFLCLFTSNITTLMTTGTLVVNISFWVSFGICASIPMFIEKKYE